MFKVVCIRLSHFDAEPNTTPLIVGNIYTVIETCKHTEFKRPASPGTFYRFVEKKDWHHESLFVVINEDQQDETEFSRNYQKEIV